MVSLTQFFVMLYFSECLLQVQRSSVPNRPGAPRGTAGIMPRGRDGWHRTGPLAVVRCRAKSFGTAGLAGTAGPYTLGHS